MHRFKAKKIVWYDSIGALRLMLRRMEDPGQKKKIQPSLAYSCLSLHLAKPSHTFYLHLSQRSQWKKKKAFVFWFSCLTRFAYNKALFCEQPYAS